MSSRQASSPLLIDHEIEARNAEFGNPAVISGEQPEIDAWVPLHAGDRVVGVFSLQNLDSEYAFDEADVRRSRRSRQLERRARECAAGRRDAQTQTELAIINGIQ